MTQRRVGPTPRPEKDRRDSGEQSGSTGRNPGTGDSRDDGANTGQDDYGMNQTGARPPKAKRVDRDRPGSEEHGDSNFGSGRADREVDGVDSQHPHDE